MTTYDPQLPPEMQSPPKPWNQQPRHSSSREFTEYPTNSPRHSQAMQMPASHSSRDLPAIPPQQYEQEQDVYDERLPAPEDDNDDFFSGAASQNSGLHPPTGYNPAVGDYRTQGSHASQSVRSPSPPPGPLLDQSHLRPGNQASLLSHERTLELYRANAKKTQDPDLQFEFAVFMIDASKTMPIPVQTHGNVMEVEKAIEKREDLIREAMALLKRLADRGHPQSQYFLADCYANGIGTVKNKQDFDRAYPLFVLAAKHNHPDAAYRAGVCCENGWGCRRESPKALQFFKKAAAALHPGAMYRLGIAELNGELSLSKSPKEGVKWLKRSAEHATAEFPHALHELALLHERGIDNVLFVDYEYSTELLAQAAELGYAPSAYRLGECYEYGKMGCPQDPALSIHYYNIAAQQNHRDACFALTAWYLVGSPGVLPQSDTEAYLWAKRAADAGLVKAMYAVGYFTEVGIGSTSNMQEAIAYYKRAAELGDKRAAQRLKGSQTQAVHQPGGPGSVLHRGQDEINGKGKDCIIM
ncbi:Sel1 domain-containing protein [Crepidotus variabilis]|uniref:Sel1 domain-containing protein n=1 Tax=Crepidotus variabilis TaxID=179855 RepID=A0A9P6ENF0_9AGAR|nr:Sel1 domain-containing protein [Crepidotus variabilis]